MKLLLIALITACASPAVARIGETWDQCEARYGKPARVEKDTAMVLYYVQGKIIACQFYEGVCDRIHYTYTFQDGTGKCIPLELSEGEIEYLLTGIGTSEKWTRLPSEDNMHCWLTEHGTLHAFYLQKERMLSVITAPAVAREMARSKAKAK